MRKSSKLRAFLIVGILGVLPCAAADLTETSQVRLGERVAAFLQSEWDVLQKILKGKPADAYFQMMNTRIFVTVVGRRGEGEAALIRMKEVQRFATTQTAEKIKDLFGVELTDDDLILVYYDPETEKYKALKDGKLVDP